jgi:hypothetical protein
MRRGLGDPHNHAVTRGHDDTSGQTWLTAARPETHQNLIYTAKEQHRIREQMRRTATEKPPRYAGPKLRRTETSLWSVEPKQDKDFFSVEKKQKTFAHWRTR